MFSNLVGSGEQVTEVINGEVNGHEEKDNATTQTPTTEPVNGVQQDNAGEHFKCVIVLTCILLAPRLHCPGK